MKFYVLLTVTWIFISTIHAFPGVKQEMILIPAGEFSMGMEPSNAQNYVDNSRHRVRVDSFYLDRHEVTNAQYQKFCEATGHVFPEFWGMDEFFSGPGFPDHPVIGVTWADANAFAEWNGKRLPTEAEWEYAARGGLVDQQYPNGNEMDSTLANYFGTRGHPVPVGSYSKNGWGLFDMAGNVAEWVHDYYDKDYYLSSPLTNPQGPEFGKRRIIRGGGWRSGISCNSVYFRQSLRTYWVDFGVGFRCAKSLE